MAKITDFKFEINGEKYVVHVNVNSGGQFSANLPEPVSSALKLRSKIIKDNLSELESEFWGAIKRYKDSETIQEHFILIRYAASGRYNEKADGFPLFGGYDNPYTLGGGSTINNNIDGLGFEFKVCIKETIDGVSTWHETDIPSHGNTRLYPDNRLIEVSKDDYHKSGKCYDADKCKKIPFSIDALRTLNNAREKIRSASEALYNFIEQDEEQILLTLTNQKLLN